MIPGAVGGRNMENHKFPLARRHVAAALALSTLNITLVYPVNGQARPQLEGREPVYQGKLINAQRSQSLSLPVILKLRRGLIRREVTILRSNVSTNCARD